MNEIKSIKEAIKDMKAFMEGGTPKEVTDPKQFGIMLVRTLEALNYKVEELERQIGPSSAFIEANDIPNRLR